jgi:hypothetical protein
MTRFAACCLYYKNYLINYLYIMRTVLGGAWQRCHPHMYMRDVQCLLLLLIVAPYADTNAVVPNGGCE